MPHRHGGETLGATPHRTSSAPFASSTLPIAMPTPSQRRCRFGGWSLFHSLNARSTSNAPSVAAPTARHSASSHCSCSGSSHPNLVCAGNAANRYKAPGARRGSAPNSERTSSSNLSAAARDLNSTAASSMVSGEGVPRDISSIILMFSSLCSGSLSGSRSACPNLRAASNL